MMRAIAAILFRIRQLLQHRLSLSAGQSAHPDLLEKCSDFGGEGPLSWHSGRMFILPQFRYATCRFNRVSLIDQLSTVVTGWSREENP